jgi:hypothetical protein
MARGTLHSPKPEGQKRRRNSPTHGETMLVRDDEVRGPSLEEATGVAAESWLPQVVTWWETWRNAPQAQVFEATDWGRLAMLAPIVQAYWKRPSAAALSEIRMNEERLGATVVDRMRARLRIEEDDVEGEDAQVVRLVSSRDDVTARLREVEDE